MVTLTLLCLIVGGSQMANFWEKILKIIDNFSPGAFYSYPRIPLTVRYKREADFGHYGAWVWVNLLKKENL